MKYLLTTVLLLTSTVTAQANKELCTAISDNASLIMELRQSNAPLSDVLEVVDGITLLEELVMEAYKEPRYSSDEYQSNAIADFGNLAMLNCLQSFKERKSS